MNPLQLFRSEIRELLERAISMLNLESDVTLQTPPEGKGDFAFPCFSLSKHLRKKPDEIAREIVISIAKSDLVERVVSEGAYINFYINTERLKEITLRAILEERERYGNFEEKREKIILEHTSANPTGPLHVGRARNPIIGDTLARILRAYGYRVETQYYVNDIGKQAAMLTWAVENVKEEIGSERDKIDHRLVKYYQRANEMMESDETVSEEINSLLSEFEKGKVGKRGKTCEKMMEGINQSLNAINIFVDRFVKESMFIEDGSVYEVVERLKNSKYCKEEDGAYYLDLEDFGIHGRDTRFFFTRKDGTTLYTTRDLAYHVYKFKSADILINILGEDHKLQARQLAIALKMLGEERTPDVIFYAFVSLPEGKMSTRKGRVVYLDDLVDESIERALDEVRKRREDLPEERMRSIAKVVGIGALRYNIIRVQAEKQITFRWNEALNFEGNSAPFIQYSHARACSILRKGGNYDGFDPSLLKEKGEIELIKVLSKFPDVIEECALKRKCHTLASYCYELATTFNQFYRDVPVLKGGKARDSRLALVDASRIVLARGLELLGIDAPDEM